MSSSEFIRLRPIQKSDDLKVKKIILESLEEYGANREGFAAKDPELESLFNFYQKVGGVYYVSELKDNLVGGAGIAPLAGDDQVWELQKMYVSRGGRGNGVGKLLLKTCIDEAKKRGLKSLYIETLDSMKEANHLYQKFGFERIQKPLGNTGHFGCDRYYLKKLNE